MKARILVAVIGLPILLAVLLFLPAWAAAAVTGLICALASYELLCGTGLIKNLRIMVITSVMAMFVCLWSVLGRSPLAMQAGIFLFFLALCLELLVANTKLDFSLICLAIFAGVGIPYLLSSILRIMQLENGRILVLVPFVMTMVPDSGAFFVGCAFGKHKLAPEISPKKSVEGVFGGVAAGIAGMFLFCLVVHLTGLRCNWQWVAVYGLLGALGSVIGDLVFSTIKRQTGIKDFGHFLPGHGGALDRFDSLVLVAPMTELLMALIPLVK